jgi:hypothetical protein
MPSPGEIWLDSDFFGGPPLKRKYFLVLAVAQGDVTHRLLTSQPHGRSEKPACSHADPYPSFFLGVLSAPLVKNSWLDLSAWDDLDVTAFARMERAGRLRLIMVLPPPTFCAALRCAYGAPDTSGRQAKRIGDVAAAAGCP